MANVASEVSPNEIIKYKKSPTICKASNTGTRNPSIKRKSSSFVRLLSLYQAIRDSFQTVLRVISFGISSIAATTTVALILNSCMDSMDEKNIAMGIIAPLSIDSFLSNLSVFGAIKNGNYHRKDAPSVPIGAKDRLKAFLQHSSVFYWICLFWYPFAIYLLYSAGIKASYYRFNFTLLVFGAVGIVLFGTASILKVKDKATNEGALIHRKLKERGKQPIPPLQLAFQISKLTFLCFFMIWSTWIVLSFVPLSFDSSVLQNSCLFFFCASSMKVLCLALLRSYKLKKSILLRKGHSLDILTYLIYTNVLIRVFIGTLQEDSQIYTATLIATFIEVLSRSCSTIFAHFEIQRYSKFRREDSSTGMRNAIKFVKWRKLYLEIHAFEIFSEMASEYIAMATSSLIVMLFNEKSAHRIPLSLEIVFFQFSLEVVADLASILIEILLGVPIVAVSKLSIQDQDNILQQMRQGCTNIVYCILLMAQRYSKISSNSTDSR